MRSAFEGLDWIDRIAANPAKEHHRKKLNQKTNDVQHSKLSFATQQKRMKPEINFLKTTMTTTGNTFTPSASAASTDTPSPPVPDQPSRQTGTNVRPSGDFTRLVQQEAAAQFDTQPASHASTNAQATSMAHGVTRITVPTDSRHMYGAGPVDAGDTTIGPTSRSE